MAALYLHINNINVFHHLLNEVSACCLQVLWLFLVYACISTELWKFLGLLFLSSVCDAFFFFLPQPWLLSGFSLDGFSLNLPKCSSTRSPERLPRCRSWGRHHKAAGGGTSCSRWWAWELSLHQCQQLPLSCLQGPNEFRSLSWDF